MNTTMPAITSLEQILGKSCSREEALNSLKQHPESYSIFSSFRPVYPRKADFLQQWITVAKPVAYYLYIP